MLLQLRDYIQRERVVSLQQLSRVFSIDGSALQPILILLASKGLIQPHQNTTACQRRCGGCSGGAVVFYESRI